MRFNTTSNTSTLAFIFFLLLLASALSAQPYSCNGVDYPMAPSPGNTNLDPVGSPLPVTVGDFLNYLDSRVIPEWQANHGVQLASFPYAVQDAPTSSPQELERWLIAGVASMFVPSNGVEALNVPISPRLNSTAACVAACAAANGSNAIPHGCLSGQINNTLQDFVVMLGPPVEFGGANWSFGLMRENVAFGFWPNHEAAVVPALWRLLFQDGQCCNNSHFNSLVPCRIVAGHAYGSALIDGVDPNTGVTIQCLVMHHLRDPLGQGTGAWWSGQPNCPNNILPLYYDVTEVVSTDHASRSAVLVSRFFEDVRSESADAELYYLVNGKRVSAGKISRTVETEIIDLEAGSNVVEVWTSSLARESRLHEVLSIKVIPTEPMVYPNPAIARISVILPKESVGENILLLSPIGSVIREVPLAAGSNSVTIPVATLPSGVYYVTTDHSAENWVKRVVKY